MRRLSWFNKLAFLANIVLTILTGIAYVLPFLAPKLYPIFAVLTLFMPLFLILNALFFVLARSDQKPNVVVWLSFAHRNYLHNQVL